MRAIDKLDRLGIDGVRMLLGKGRKDESGDFTKGAELNDAQIAGIVDAISGTSKATCRRNGAGDQELAEIASLVKRSRLWRPGSHRQDRRPRPRILHRPRFRG